MEATRTLLPCLFVLPNCKGSKGGESSISNKLFGDKRRGTFVLHSDGPGTSRIFRDSVITFLFFLLKNYLFLCFWLHWAFVATHSLSLVAESRRYFPVAAHRLIIVMTSLVEYGL